MTKRRIYTCTVCQKSDHWGPGWGWYGSWKQLDDQGVPGVAPIIYCCSEDCKQRAMHEKLIPIDADEIE